MADIYCIPNIGVAINSTGSNMNFPWVPIEKEQIVNIEMDVEFKEEENYEYKVDNIKSVIEFETIFGLEYNLKKNVITNIEYENDYYMISNEELGIFEGADNFEEAKIEFFDFFIHDFLNWMETPTSELSDEAKELKSKYLEYVDYK